MARRTSYLVVGILLLFGATLAFLAVLGALVGTATDPSNVGLASFSAACGTLLGIVGLGLLLLYRQNAQHDARFNTLVAVLEHVTEVSVAEVGRTIQASPTEAMALITEAIQSGRISGHLDPRAGRFVRTAPGFPGIPTRADAPIIVPSPSPGDAMEPRFCRECGSRIERISDGSGFRCPDCGHQERG